MDFNPSDAQTGIFQYNKVNTYTMVHDALGWGLLSQFTPFRFVIFSNFHNNQNNVHLYDITFIFDRCHRRWAAETPHKYERDRKSLTYTFAKSKFPITEKLTNRALVTPTPGSLCHQTISNHDTCIEYAVYISSCLPHVKISTKCTFHCWKW